MQFALALHHERHCMWMLRGALADGMDESLASDEHATHCLNYIRQMVLCYPDLTLEPPDVLNRDYETRRYGATHVCYDWESQLKWGDENSDEWFKLKDEIWTAGLRDPVPTPRSEL